MIKKLLPVLLALIGTGAGIGAGLFLAPKAPANAAAGEHAPADEHAAGEHNAEAAHDEHDETLSSTYVKLNNQFVIPIVSSDRVKSLVVLSLSLEIQGPGQEAIYNQEPKLRDVFLRVLFDHANIGGFEGNFTESRRMDILRRSLHEAARNVLGSIVSDVLITEIARQDI
ncbi:flagellar basal body-associated FliL family protein [Citreicella sp. C3M06]|uniref:flagellar basal body-associated FliL family protein n=1 Tax=Citreicella sp. C3M06 TaxID=2841564 RepID=UPI001C0828EF|nr:flagellar basal body-associated FliL family protein [Citreicella sp. C3M06]MBU2960700.1 flagellar basal body-associated FliL family protein [Citreicella sp. C3M06]